MKLNMYALEHELNDVVIGSSLSMKYVSPTIEYPILFTAGEKQYSENIVYVAIDKHLKDALEIFKRNITQNRDKAFYFICIGEPPEFYLEHENCNVLWVDPNITRTNLFNVVQKTFQRYNVWKHELEGIAQSGGEINDLVKVSLKIFRNDICITDQFGKVISHKVYRTRKLSKEQTDSIKEGEYLPKNMIYDGVEDEQEGEDFTSFDPVFSEMKAFSCPVLRSTISLALDYTLYLSIHPNYQNVGEKDRPAALIFANAIKQLYSTYDIIFDNANYISAESAFKALLQGNLDSETDLIRCSLSLGWNHETDSFLCFCIDFMPHRIVQDDCFMRPFISVSNHIKTCLGCLSFVLDGRIIAIANKEQIGLEESALLARFENFAHEYQLIMGVSALYRGCRSLSGSYRQAFAALRKGYGSTDNKHLFCFEDNALEIGMNFIIKELSPEFFCPKELITLALKEPDLYKALETYLKANCNSSVASKQLYLQRNSFIYRLEKIKRMLPLDLDDPDTRLLLLTSFKLIEYYGIESLRANALGGSSIK